MKRNKKKTNQNDQNHKIKISFGIKKPFEYDVKSQIHYSAITVRDKGFIGENGSTQILVFIDMKLVRQTIDDLYRQVAEWNRAWAYKYKDLDEDARNKLEIKLEFDEQQPLVDFNNHYGFYSLYQKIAKDELVWLNNEELDLNKDPDDHFIFQYSTRAILNTDCEVQVGDTLYKLTEYGYFEIGNNNLSSLKAINQNPNNYQSIPDVIFVGDESGKAAGCESNKRNSDYKPSGSYRIKWVVSHWTHPWGRRCAAKTDNYKKSGTWKKYSTYCTVMVYGYISDVDASGGANCDKQLNFNPNSYYAAATAKHVEHFIPVQTKTKSGWVQSRFYGAGGITHTKTLTW